MFGFIIHRSPDGADSSSVPSVADNFPAQGEAFDKEIDEKALFSEPTDADADADADADDKAPDIESVEPDEKLQTVPRARLDKMAAERNEYRKKSESLELMLEEARGKVPEQEESLPVTQERSASRQDLYALYTKLRDAEYDGEDSDVIDPIRDQIRDIELEEAVAKLATVTNTNQDMTVAVNEANIENAAKTYLDGIVRATPALDRENADYNSSLEGDIITLLESRINNGIPKDVAAKEAIAMGFRAHGLDVPGEEGDNKPDTGRAASVSLTKREEAELQSAIARNQPGRKRGGLGSRSSENDSATIDDIRRPDSWEKVPEATQNKLLYG